MLYALFMTFALTNSAAAGELGIVAELSDGQRFELYLPDAREGAEATVSVPADEPWGLNLTVAEAHRDRVVLDSESFGLKRSADRLTRVPLLTPEGEPVLPFGSPVIQGSATHQIAMERGGETITFYLHGHFRRAGDCGHEDMEAYFEEVRGFATD